MSCQHKDVQMLFLGYNMRGKKQTWLRNLMSSGFVQLAYAY